MAKLSSIAFAGGVLAAADGASRSAAKLGRHHRVRPDNSNALLESARPYRRGGRRLDQQGGVGGSYSVKFSQCVDLKLMDQDLFDEDVVSYAEAGSILSARSYVLFHVCQGDDCYYESDDDLYVVDISTYVKNVASYHASVRADYCDACDAWYNGYCNANDGAAANDDAAPQDDYFDGDDAARRRTTSYIDCDQCEAYGCANNGDDDAQRQQNDDDDGALELIEDIAGCLNTGTNWNNEDVYVGFMCSPYDGDGVEIAVFLDDQCTVYTNLKAFGDIPSYYIYNNDNVFAEAEAYVKAAFTETTPCAASEYGNPNYQNNGDDDANADEDNGMNDYCDGLFDAGPVAFDSCDQNDDDGNDGGNNDNNNNGNDDDAYSWYMSDINYDDSRDLYEVCSVLQRKAGEYSYQYDAENSGTWNSHSGWPQSSGGGGRGKKTTGRWGFLGEQQDNFATSPAMIALYVFIGLALVLCVLFLVGLREKRKREDHVYLGGRLV